MVDSSQSITDMYAITTYSGIQQGWRVSAGYRLDQASAERLLNLLERVRPTFLHRIEPDIIDLKLAD